MPRLSAQQLQEFLESEFSQTTAVVEAVGHNSARIRREVDAADLRPGGTISGPTMMSLADTATYVAVLAQIGIVPLAVTTNLTINFMRKPAAGKPLVADAVLLKLGKRIAVADVKIYSGSDDVVVAHAGVTYSIPPR